nr:MAG TPA: hypothetical protein [Caudoviricetes sp.]DAV78826.1 MAG TPA: hypothetical protein [Caudoviricetes sp.]
MVNRFQWSKHALAKVIVFALFLLPNPFLRNQ